MGGGGRLDFMRGLVHFVVLRHARELICVQWWLTWSVMCVQDQEWRLSSSTPLFFVGWDPVCHGGSLVDLRHFTASASVLN